MLSAPLDDTLLMMDLDEGLYYEAAGAGGRIWELLAEPATAEEIVAVLLAEFAVEPAQCAAEVAAFIDDLLAHGLVVRVGAAATCG